MSLPRTSPPRTSLCESDVPAEDVPVEDVLGGNVHVEDIMSPSSPCVDVLDEDVLSGDIRSTQGRPQGDVLDGDICVCFYFCPFVVPG